MQQGQQGQWGQLFYRFFLKSLMFIVLTYHDIEAFATD